jgi:hypothetical protein
MSKTLWVKRVTSVPHIWAIASKNVDELVSVRPSVGDLVKLRSGNYWFEIQVVEDFGNSYKGDVIKIAGDRYDNGFLFAEGVRRGDSVCFDWGDVYELFLLCPINRAG